MGYEFKELTIGELNIVINKYINYYNSEGGKWTYESAKKRLKQIF
ncbi:MAG: GNAT family N-acetyltransferase, partial [Tissierella sp.]|nr:GNAT family N-acetyltransferase [Tissierella sp.]